MIHFRRQTWTMDVLTCIGGFLSAWYSHVHNRLPGPDTTVPLPNEEQIIQIFSRFQPALNNLWKHIDEFLHSRFDVPGAPGRILGLLMALSGDFHCLCVIYKCALLSLIRVRALT